ncbi:MAG: hypothetical protein AB3N17_11215 [Tateyamaria sp.]
MTLLKNMLAIFGVLILAFNTAGELSQIVALSKQIAFVFENWNDLVRDIWREICTRLGLPVFDLLARPFSFLVASLVLTVSVVVSLSHARDTFFENVTQVLVNEAKEAQPNAERATKRLAMEMETATRLSLFDASGKRVLPWDNSGVGTDISLGGIVIFTAIYALLDVRALDGIDWLETVAVAFTLLCFAYVIPFAFLANAAAKIGKRFWPTASGRTSVNDLFLLRQERPDFAGALNAYHIALVVFDDDLEDLDQQKARASAGKPPLHYGRPAVGLPLFEAMTEMVPNSFFERKVYAKMWERLLASMLVVLAIYVISYAIIILETVGIISV